MVDCIIRPGDWILVEIGEVPILNGWYQVRIVNINTPNLEDERFHCYTWANISDEFHRQWLTFKREWVKEVISDETMAQRLNSVLTSAMADSAVARVVRDSELSSEGSHT